MVTILYIIIWRKELNITLVVESVITGYCLFTRWQDRAKLFTESEANELLEFLKRTKFNERDKFFKQPYYDNNSNAIRQEKKS